MRIGVGAMPLSCSAFSCMGYTAADSKVQALKFTDEGLVPQLTSSSVKEFETARKR